MSLLPFCRIWLLEDQRDCAAKKRKRKKEMGGSGDKIWLQLLQGRQEGMRGEGVIILRAEQVQQKQFEE